MPTITKKNLIDRIAQNTQTKHVLVKATVQDFLNGIIAELAKGNRLEFRDFGVFEPRDCAPRTAQNPKTLEQVQVPSKRVVKFKPSRLMKQELNNQNAKEQRLIQGATILVIERIWKYVKGASLANFDFGDVANLRQAIAQVFDEINRNWNCIYPIAINWLSKIGRLTLGIR